MRYPTDKTKQKEQRGTGYLGAYKPYIQGRDFNSSGTCEFVHDWITGRGVELLSQGEALYWYILRFDPNIVDIQEQYPLDNASTNEIADKLGLRHPRARNHIMTTDFLITYRDGHQEAHSFKSSKSVLNNNRTSEKLLIEKQYWESKGIRFRIIFKDELNKVYANNIRMCSYYADKQVVCDETSCLKYMIIHHLIDIDTMKSEPLNIQTQLSIHESEVNKLWKTLQ